MSEAKWPVGPDDLIELNDNGAWSWFMHPRAVLSEGKLIVGSVRAVGTFDEGMRSETGGNIEVAVHDFATGRTGKTVLHPRLEQDDHNNPGFIRRTDRRYLALYTKHAVERKIYIAVSEPGDPLTWSEPRTFIPPGQDRQYGGDNATYSNLFRMPDGSITNFFRGVGHDPNYMVSHDEGETWEYGGRFLKGLGGYSPYLRYAYDGKGMLHFIATPDHPRSNDNSLFHASLKDGVIHGSDGTVLGPLSTTQEPSLAIEELTMVFQGDPDNVAWTVDLVLDEEERPVGVFSVQKDGRGLPPRQGGMDLRYHYARWDGSQWHTHEMAYAGTRLYPFEDDYPGLAAIDPRDPQTLYISTNADPVTGEPLISEADGERHYELFLGKTGDGGKTWSWTPVTKDSTEDNLRPILACEGENGVLVWMRGTYRNNHGEWTTRAVAVPVDGE